MEVEKIPTLGRLMLTKMAAWFPGEDLAVLASPPLHPFPQSGNRPAQCPDRRHDLHRGIT